VVRSVPVIAAIDDPWDLGEAIGWPTLEALLAFEPGNREALLSLAGSIDWKGLVFQTLNVRPRHVDSDWSNLDYESGLACSAWSSDRNGVRLILTLRRSSSFCEFASRR
jgi:hypothetical protein